MPELDEMKDKANQAAQNAQNQASQSSQDMQDKAGDESDTEQDKSGNMMDQAKKRMDTDGDGNVDSDEAKDAVGKVKGLFKKD
jgi:F0F1-type ATP synthase membrane subunit b/b'